MADNTEWLQLVVSKLHRLYMEGSDFFDERWKFEWDSNLSKTDNFRNIVKEERALNTLTKAKVLITRSDENWFRNQVLEAQEELEIAKSLNPNIPDWATNTVWGDWNTTDPAHREYDYIWFIDGFDYDRFVQFCETHGFSLNSTNAARRETLKPRGIGTPATPAVRTVTPHPLQPRHYSQRTGVLTLSPTVDVHISNKGKTKRSNGKKYQQCLTMDRLFKSVNTIKSGINFSTALSVHESKIGKKEEKKIRNAVAEINKKVAEVGGPKNLIKIQNKKIFVNNSYLE